MVQYTVSTTTNPRQDVPIYAIKVTTNDDSSGFIVGSDGEAMFFAGKSEARAKLVEMKKEDGWNCEADV